MATSPEADRLARQVEDRWPASWLPGGLVDGLTALDTDRARTLSSRLLRALPSSDDAARQAVILAVLDRVLGVLGTEGYAEDELRDLLGRYRAWADRHDPHDALESPVAKLARRLVRPVPDQS